MLQKSRSRGVGSVDIGTHPAGYQPVGIGDFNHDGTLDLAVQGRNGARATSAPVGVITGAGALAGHLARQRATRRAAASVSTTASGS